MGLLGFSAAVVLLSLCIMCLAASSISDIIVLSLQKSAVLSVLLISLIYSTHLPVQMGINH